MELDRHDVRIRAEANGNAQQVGIRHGASARRIRRRRRYRGSERYGPTTTTTAHSTPRSDCSTGQAAGEAAQNLNTHFREENPDVERYPTITSHATDVASPEGVHNTMEEILKQHNQKIDILVTSAGFTENFKAEEYPPDRMQKLWDVNVNGTYFCAAEVARHMIKRGKGGSMVLISSMSGSIVNVPQPQVRLRAIPAATNRVANLWLRHPTTRPRPQSAIWPPLLRLNGLPTTSELTLYRMFSLTHKSYSTPCFFGREKLINFYLYSPGYMLTPLTEKILDEKPDLKNKWTSLIPVGKMGRPEDLMGAVVFLSSEAAGYVTGAELRVDGGYTVT